MKYVVFDFESASKCDLLKSGAWKYAQDFSTFLTHIGYKIVEDNRPQRTKVLWMKALGKVDLELEALCRDPAVMFVAHNCSFEIGMFIEHMVTMGYTMIPNDRWHDTMAVAAMKSLPLGLDPLIKALNLPVQKDMEGHKLMLKLCKPDANGGWAHHTQDALEREAVYNVGDVDGQFGVHQAIGGLGHAERQVWLADAKINQRGVLVDVKFVHACMDVLDQVRIPMTNEFRLLTGGVAKVNHEWVTMTYSQIQDLGPALDELIVRGGLAPTQREKILGWVNSRGVLMDNMRKETLDALLDPDDNVGLEDLDQLGIEPMPIDVYRVLGLRRSLASSSVAKLERMLQCACHDGRVRYTMQYHGAGTGRWSGRLIQIQNYPRGEISDRQGLTPEVLADAILTRDLDVIRAIWGPDIFSAVISSLRSCIVADEAKGRELAVGDYAQVEARNVLSFAGHHDKALQFDQVDQYNEMASMIFKRQINRKLDTDKREGQIGKNALLGSGFGLGPTGFQAKFAPNEPFSLAELAINTYRKEFAPLVPTFWYGLYQASVDAVWCNASRTYSWSGIEFRKENEFLTMRLPNGRKIYYHKPMRETSFNPKTQREYPAWSFVSYQGKKTRRNFAWYGQLMNNLVQGSARDLVANAILTCERENMPVIFTAHDEIVTEIKKRPDAAQVLKEIMEDIPSWARERKFNVKAETGTMIRYRK